MTAMMLNPSICAPGAGAIASFPHFGLYFGMLLHNCGVRRKAMIKLLNIVFFVVCSSSSVH
jgi:hypothetical protein